MFHTRVHKIDANSQLAGRSGKGGGGEVRKWRAERRRVEGTEKGREVEGEVERTHCFPSSIKTIEMSLIYNPLDIQDSSLSFLCHFCCLYAFFKFLYQR